MKELERRGNGDNRFKVAIGVGNQRIEVSVTALDCLPSPIAEQRPEALASGEQFAREANEWLEFGGDRRELGSPVSKEFVDAGLDQVH